MSMDPQREIGRLLLVVGLLLAALGVLLSLGSKLPFRLGRLPGDIVIKRDHFTFFLPLATSLLVSLGLSLLFWLWRRKP